MTFIFSLKALILTYTMSRKKSVVKHYDETSRFYDELYFPEQLKKHVIALSLVNPDLGAKVLDVGCGTGLLLEKLAQIDHLAVGVDISRNMLEVAKHRVDKGVMLVVADAEALPFKNESFEAVFLITVLQNLSNPVKGLKEAFRVLNRGGKAFITFLKKAEGSSRFRQRLKISGFKVETILDLEGIPDLMTLCVKV